MSKLDDINATLLETELALGAFPDNSIDNQATYSYGIVDGLKMAGIAFSDLDKNPQEVFEATDLDPTVLDDRSQVLGMLAGVLAGIRLFGGVHISSAEEQAEAKL